MRQNEVSTILPKKKEVYNDFENQMGEIKSKIN